MNAGGRGNGLLHHTPGHARIAETQVRGRDHRRRDSGNGQSRMPYSLILYCSARRLIPNSFAALSR